MKRKGFKNLGTVILSGLLVGACSPVAPSVSKLSNAAADKTNTTDGSSPLNNISTSGSLTSHNSGSTSGSSSQKTAVETREDFARRWTVARDMKPSMRLDSATVDEFAMNGKVSFTSNSDKVKGQEAALSALKTEIHLVMHVDQATLTKEQMSKIKVSLTWVPVSATNKEAHWELTLEPPKPDDVVKDVTDYNHMKELLQSHLEGIVISFDQPL